MGEGPAILATGLVKRYDDLVAVDHVDLEVARGECFGLLGHNGAGKSVTIRMLTCRTRPTSGMARVFGHDVVSERDAVRRRINVVFDEQNLHPRLSGRDTLRFWSRMYGVSTSRVDDLLELVGLDPARQGLVKDWSTGMRQRLLVARALINEPDLLFLDEPTRGLDPASARSLRSIVSGLVERGTTVFLTTHDMHEADALCDRVAFLTNGRIVALDTPRRLRMAETSDVVLEVVLDDESVHQLNLDQVADARKLDDWSRARRVRTVHSQEPTLADVFVRLAGRPLDEDGAE